MSFKGGFAAARGGCAIIENRFWQTGGSMLFSNCTSQAGTRMISDERFASMTQCILDTLMFSHAACPSAREATVAPSTLVIVVLEGWRHQAGQSSAFHDGSSGSPGFLQASWPSVAAVATAGEPSRWLQVVSLGFAEKRAILMSEFSPCSLEIWCYSSLKKRNNMLVLEYLPN